jgi:hypothetical protein
MTKVCNFLLKMPGFHQAHAIEKRGLKAEKTLPMSSINFFQEKKQGFY